MNIESVNYTFQNDQLIEYNDVVFRERTFDLKGHEFSFRLKPSGSTQFWRFGVVFSRYAQFIFEPSQGRYNNEDLRFIEVNVGGRVSGKWQNPGDIALSSYYFRDRNPPYDQFDQYNPATVVELHLRYMEGEDNAPSEISFQYFIDNREGQSVSLPIGDYRYFNIVVRINPGLKDCNPLSARATG